MNWEDESFLLSKRKFRENANIINIFTLNRGKISGIVYGGNSRKIRNYLQISNKLFIFYTSKNDIKVGYLKAELIKAFSFWVKMEKYSVFLKKNKLFFY